MKMSYADAAKGLASKSPSRSLLAPIGGPPPPPVDNEPNDKSSASNDDGFIMVPTKKRPKCDDSVSENHRRPPGATSSGVSKRATVAPSRAYGTNTLGSSGRAKTPNGDDIFFIVITADAFKKIFGVGEKCYNSRVKCIKKTSGSWKVTHEKLPAGTYKILATYDRNEKHRTSKNRWEATLRDILGKEPKRKELEYDHGCFLAAEGTRLNTIKNETGVCVTIVCEHSAAYFLGSTDEAKVKAETLLEHLQKQIVSKIIDDDLTNDVVTLLRREFPTKEFMKQTGVLLDYKPSETQGRYKVTGTGFARCESAFEKVKMKIDGLRSLKPLVADAVPKNKPFFVQSVPAMKAGYLSQRPQKRSSRLKELQLMGYEVEFLPLGGEAPTDNELKKDVVKDALKISRKSHVNMKVFYPAGKQSAAKRDVDKRLSEIAVIAKDNFPLPAKIFLFGHGGSPVDDLSIKYGVFIWPEDHQNGQSTTCHVAGSRESLRAFNEYLEKHKDVLYYKLPGIPNTVRKYVGAARIKAEKKDANIQVHLKPMTETRREPYVLHFTTSPKEKSKKTVKKWLKEELDVRLLVIEIGDGTFEHFKALNIKTFLESLPGVKAELFTHKPCSPHRLLAIAGGKRDVHDALHLVANSTMDYCGLGNGALFLRRIHGVPLVTEGLLSCAAAQPTCACVDTPKTFIWNRLTAERWQLPSGYEQLDVLGEESVLKLID